MDSAVRICLKLLLLAFWSRSLMASPAKSQLVDSYRNQQLPDIPGYIPVYIKHEVPAYPFKSNTIKHRPLIYKDGPIRRTTLDHPKRENKHHQHHEHHKEKPQQEKEKNPFEDTEFKTDDKHHKCSHHTTKVAQTTEKSTVQDKHHCAHKVKDEDNKQPQEEDEEKEKEDEEEKEDAESEKENDDEDEAEDKTKNENQQGDQKRRYQYEHRPYQNQKSEQVVKKGQHIRPYHKVIKQQQGEIQKRHSQAYPVYYHKFENPGLYLRNKKPQGTNNYFFE